MKHSKAIIEEPNIKGFDSRIIPPSLKGEAYLKFSYELLVKDNEYYNFWGLCEKGLMKWFELLKEISKISVDRLIAGQFSSKTSPFRFHKIIGEPLEELKKFSSDISAESECYQIRFGVSNGGIHGVLIDEIFYVVLLDPNHYLYHESKFGPKKPHTTGQCDCEERKAEYIQLREAYDEKFKECEKLWEELDEKTKP